MVQDLTIGRNGIKAGVIGEVGCQYPMADVERKSLIAAGKAQVFIVNLFSIFPPFLTIFYESYIQMCPLSKCGTC